MFTSPHLSDGRDWTFCQYTDRARMDGYQGKERRIDLNVFCQGVEEFNLYPNKVSRQEKFR